MKSKAIKPIYALLLAVSLALSFQTVANPITRQQAQQNALVFMQDRGKSISMSSLRHAPMRSAQPDELRPYYVFNIGDNQGYVIASGDDCAYAVLGYSDEGSIDLNNLPCNLQAWLDGYAQQIQYLQEHGVTASRAPRETDNRPAIAPMLTCQWNQYSPYNMYCPIDPVIGRQCVTGCVATAMAQVMYYYRDRSVNQTTYEIPAYTTKTRGINIDAIPAGSMIDWDNMIDSYNSGNYPTETQKQAVGNLSAVVVCLEPEGCLPGPGNGKSVVAGDHGIQTQSGDKEAGRAPDSLLLIRGACSVGNIYGIAIGVLAPQVEAHIIDLRAIFGKGLVRIRAALSNRSAGGQWRLGGDGPDVGVVGRESDFQRLGEIHYVTFLYPNAELRSFGISERADFQLPEIGVGRHLHQYCPVQRVDGAGYLPLDFKLVDISHHLLVDKVVPLIGAGRKQ